MGADGEVYFKKSLSRYPPELGFYNFSTYLAKNVREVIENVQFYNENLAVPADTQKYN